MKNSILLFLLAAVVFTAGTSCNRRGCTNPAAINYDPDANRDNGTCKFEGDIVPVREGVVYIYFQGVEKPTEVTINGRNVTGQLIDAGTTTNAPEYCNNPSYSTNLIVVNLYEAYTISARNSTHEWTIKDIVLSDEYGHGDCRVIGLTKDNAKEIGAQGKTQVTFASGMETGMRNIVVRLDGDSIGVLKEWESGAEIKLTKELSAGRHGYTATSQNGHEWADSFTVAPGGTTTINLNKGNATMAAGKSNLVFYSTKAKNVSVFLDNNYIGKTGAASTNNACTATSSVSYLSEGGKNYGYTATSPDGQIWTGRVDANAGSGCILVVLE